MNPLISFMANQANNNSPAFNILQQFSEFRKNWTPETAQNQINQMIQSGRINAQQYEQARMMAERFKGLI